MLFVHNDCCQGDFMLACPMALASFIVYLIFPSILAGAEEKCLWTLDHLSYK